MLGLEISKAKRVLFLGAHSDDIEIGCGGLALELGERRPDLEVVWVVFSAEGIRREEAQLSAEAFLSAFKNVRIIVLQHRTSYFPYEGSKIKDDFEALKSDLDPDILFTHYREDRHQDHRLISDLAANTFRNHLILEYEIPKYDGDLGQPNVFFPISEGNASLKTEHLRRYFQTQSSKHWFSDDLFRSLMRIRGMECATPLAEAFYGRKLVLR